MSVIKFKFAFKQRVKKPGGDAQAVVTAVGCDMERGNYYTLEWMGDTGRPCCGSFWEDEVLKANPPAKPKRKKPAKAKSKSKRKH